MPLPKPSVPVYDLIIPSTKKSIKYRPFLVKEEKILLIAMESQDEKMIRDSVINILKSCIITKGVKIEQLAMFDVEYIFLRIRSKSVGEKIQLKFTSKDDGQTPIEYELDLETVEVQFPKNHNSKIALSETSGFVMKYPGFEQFLNSQILQKNPSTEDIFNIIINCIDKIYDGIEVWDANLTPKKEITEYVEALTAKQFELIQEFFITMPKLIHKVNLTNPKTGVESEYAIEGLANFFG